MLYEKLVLYCGSLADEYIVDLPKSSDITCDDGVVYYIEMK